MEKRTFLVDSAARFIEQLIESCGDGFEVVTDEFIGHYADEYVWMAIPETTLKEFADAHPEWDIYADFMYGYVELDHRPAKPNPR